MLSEGILDKLLENLHDGFAIRPPCFFFLVGFEYKNTTISSAAVKSGTRKGINILYVQDQLPKNLNMNQQ
jgi:hypothetical protein